MFFSNRSAAYLSKGPTFAAEALSDAEACVSLAPKWGKGYGRKGAALHALKRLDDAAGAYRAGLAADPTQKESLQAGLEEVEAAARAAAAARARPPFPPGGFPGGFPGGGFPGGGFPGFGANPFGPALFAQLAAKKPHLLADPVFVAKLKALEADPNALSTALGQAVGEGADPRMLEVVQLVLGGMKGGGGAGEDGGMGDGDEDDEDEEGATGGGGGGGDGRAPPPPRAAAAPPPPEPSETPEERAARLEKAASRARAVALKEAGNDKYKKRDFAGALLDYRAAAAADPEDITYLLNEAAVHFEEKRFDECDVVCVTAVERGREARAPFTAIAKAFARRGNAAYAAGNLELAVQHYGSSLLEHRTDEVLQKEKKARVELKAAQEKAYQNPELGLAAKERGNAAFKAGDFKTAIDEYTEAIKRDPASAPYYQNRATARAKMMDFNGSLDDCERALKLDPKFVKAMNRKALCQMAVKEYHKALETFRAAMALEPDNEDSKTGFRQVAAKIAESQGSGGGAESDAERQARAQQAMKDPECVRPPRCAPPLSARTASARRKRIKTYLRPPPPHTHTHTHTTTHTRVRNAPQNSIHLAGPNCEPGAGGHAAGLVGGGFQEDHERQRHGRKDREAYCGGHFGGEVVARTRVRIFVFHLTLHFTQLPLLSAPSPLPAPLFRFFSYAASRRRGTVRRLPRREPARQRQR